MDSTKTQRDRMTEILETEQPARADFELLDDGSLLVTLWRVGEVRYSPYLVRRLGRRGELMREAKRSATGWTEFTGPVDVRPPHIMPRGDDPAVTGWMRA